MLYFYSVLQGCIFIIIFPFNIFHFISFWNVYVKFILIFSCHPFNNIKICSEVPFSFPVLGMHAFSLLVSLTRVRSILLLISKNQPDFKNLTYMLVFYFIILFISSLVSLHLICCFDSLMRYMLLNINFKLSSFLIYTFKTICFSKFSFIYHTSFHVMFS